MLIACNSFIHSFINPFNHSLSHLPTWHIPDCSWPRTPWTLTSLDLLIATDTHTHKHASTDKEWETVKLLYVIVCVLYIDHSNSNDTECLHSLSDCVLWPGVLATSIHLHSLATSIHLHSLATSIHLHSLACISNKKCYRTQMIIPDV